MTFPTHCSVAKLPSFKTIEDAKQFIIKYCGEGQLILNVEYCRRCSAIHVYTYARELSGASSGTGTRRETLKIPEAAEATGRRLSRRDAERFKTL